MCIRDRSQFVPVPIWNTLHEVVGVDVDGDAHAGTRAGARDRRGESPGQVDVYKRQGKHLVMDWDKPPVYERNEDKSIKSWDFYGGSLEGIRQDLSLIHISDWGYPRRRTVRRRGIQRSLWD